MAETLTADPIMTLDQANDWGKLTDSDQTTRLVNIVSAKFLAFTQRSRITEGAIDEYVHPLDGNAAFTFTRPVSADLVTVIEHTRSGDSTTYEETDGDVFVDRTRGRIFKTSGCWDVSTGFPSLQLQYVGGWAVIPADVLEGALAQMKIEQQRFKGSVGHDAITTAGETVSIDRSSVIKEAREAWQPYRVYTR